MKIEREKGEMEGKGKGKDYDEFVLGLSLTVALERSLPNGNEESEPHRYAVFSCTTTR